MQIHFILLLAFALMIAAFALQNTMIVAVNFLLWQTNTSLVIVILVSMAAGAIMVFSADLTNKHNLKKERKELRQQLAELTKTKEELQKAFDESKKAETMEKTPAADEPVDKITIAQNNNHD